MHVMRGSGRTLWYSCVLAVLMLAEALAGARPEGVVLEPTMAWSPGCGANPATAQWYTQAVEGALRIVVYEPGHGMVLNAPVRLDIDPARTPILSMTYRATGLRAADGNAVVIAFFGGKPGTFPVVQHRDLQVDGQEHTVRIDLVALLAEKKAGREALAWMDWRVHAAAEGEAVFDLIDLRFEPGEGEAPAAETVDAKPVRVKVTDAAGRAVAGATVTLDPHLREGSVQATTDDAGQAVIASDRPDMAATRKSLQVTRDGMSEMLYTDLSSVDAQTELRATLYPTRTYGGRVTNEDGQPVARAIGELWLNGLTQNDATGRPRGYRSLRVITDEQGRWSTPPLPEDDNLDLQVRWMHPDYLQDQWGGQSGKLSMSDLKAATATSVLQRGVAVSGVVYDKQGQPLAGAFVAQGDDRFPSNAPPATHTDSQGRYHFAHVRPGRLVLTVTAKEHAPQLLQVEAMSGMAPLDFNLTGPATFRFRVVNTQGNPLKGVSICPDTWKGFRTIPSRFHTNDQGLATWQGPPDPVTFDIFTQGKLDDRGRTFTPSGGEEDVHLITLQEPLRITATVTDAETGEPVPSFNVVCGILWQNDGQQPPHWERRNDPSSRGANGKWEQAMSFSYPYRVIRIEADGYAPAVSEPIAKDAGNVSLTFALRRASALVGTLHDGSGQPVVGATVYLAMGRSMQYIRNGRIDHNRESLIDKSDEQGRFSFPPQVDDFTLIALHERGYAEMDAKAFAAAQSIATLEPWATVTGQLLVGDKPAVGEQVSINLERDFESSQRRPYHDIKATTDATGHFICDRVPPGKGTVGRYIQVGDRMWATTISARYEASPGQTVQVQLGGTGRPVVGRFVWPADARQQSLANGHHSLATQIDRDAIEAMWPEGFKTWDLEKRKAFAQSDEGKRLQEQQRALYATRQHYNFVVSADGSFRVENVDPGEYELSVSIHTPPVGNQCGPGEPIASYSGTVVVPAMPEGVVYLDEPIALGDLEVKPIKPAVQVGEAAPDFSVPVLDAGGSEAPIDLAKAAKVSLSSLRGKVVLLDFWATWCGPCVEETPHLKKVWDAVGSDEHFAMIGLSLDQSPDAPLKYARDNQLGWTQAFLGEWSKATTPGDYGVRGIPSIWLIGPDGKVIAKDLRGAAILPAVEAALMTMPRND